MMLMMFSSKLAKPLETFHGVSFHVTAPRGDWLRRIFIFVLLLGHLCGGDSSEWVCSDLSSMVINFCFSLGATHIYFIQQRFGSSRSISFGRIFHMCPTCSFLPTIFTSSTFVREILFKPSFSQQSSQWVTVKMSLKENRWFINRIPLFRSSTGR